MAANPAAAAVRGQSRRPEQAERDVRGIYGRGDDSTDGGQQLRDFKRMVPADKTDTFRLSRPAVDAESRSLTNTSLQRRRRRSHKESRRWEYSIFSNGLARRSRSKIWKRKLETWTLRFPRRKARSRICAQTCPPRCLRAITLRLTAS